MSTYHIFLVDSDRSHGQLIRNHLKTYKDYVVHVFTDWVECRKKMKLFKPAVLFVDEELKHDEKTLQNDIDWMKGIKEISPDTEVVLFTGEERINIVDGHDKKHDYEVQTIQTHIHAEKAILGAMWSYKNRASLRNERIIIACFAVAFIVIVGIVVKVYLG